MHTHCCAWLWAEQEPCLLEVVGILARQEGVGAAADEVVKGHQQVLKVVDGPLMETLHQLRP